MPAVSVVIPSYNHAAWVAAAVRSALAQTLADLEVIVVDDGSTDASRAVLAGLADARLTVVHQANAGAHAALNAGIERAAAPLVAILNSDDVYHRERLATCVAALTPEVGLVGSALEIVDAGGRVVGAKHGWRDAPPWPLAHPERSFRAGDDPRAALLAEHWLATTSNFVFRRADWRAVGGFRPLRYAHDWDFALRLAALAPPRLVERPLLQYRVHDRNTIREDRAAMVLEICWCLAVHLPRQLAAPWFGGGPARLEQLLASLHTHGCDAVLAVLLASDLARDEGLALALLDPAEPRRRPLLAAIGERLAAAPPETAATAGRTGRALDWLRSRRRA